MDCPRCKGVMAQEVFEDLLDDTGNLSFNGWRCLICGEILDPVIANIGIAKTLYDTHTNWTIAGAVGAVIGVVWNYAVSATLVWRSR